MQKFANLNLLILLILLFDLDRRPLRLRPPVPLRPPRGHRRADGAADDRRAAGPPRPTAKLAKLAIDFAKFEKFWRARSWLYQNEIL